MPQDRVGDGEGGRRPLAAGKYGLDDDEDDEDDGDNVDENI